MLRDLGTRISHRIRRHWLLILIITTGAIARFTNLHWDMGNRLHPDEALIVNGALTVRFFSHLFPGFHDYNGLSVYLLKLFSLGYTEPEPITIVGRYISATLSTLSLLLIYSLGKNLWNRNVGTTAAALLAYAPLAIQLAHFYTTETILIFLLLLLLHAMNDRSVIRMALFSGLLLATKNTAYLILPMPVISILFAMHSAKHRIHALLLFFAGAAAAWFVASPYSFIDWPGYLARSGYLNAVVTGRLLMDWTMQFQETNGFFWIPNLLWAFGPLAGIGAVGILGASMHRKPWGSFIYIAAAWSIGFFLFLMCTYLKFLRYAAPLLPLFAVFGAKYLSDLSKTTIGKTVAVVAIAVHIIYGYMFFQIYLPVHPSRSASDWIRQHIPSGSILLTEEWNSIIRFDRAPLHDTSYGLLSFNAYAPETPEKINALSAQRARADYIIVQSPKVRRTIAHLRTRYPETYRFYEQLARGDSGFTKVAEFTSYPRLGPFYINDESAEETFTVFDHPAVTIYKKTASPFPRLSP